MANAPCPSQTHILDTTTDGNLQFPFMAQRSAIALGEEPSTIVGYWIGPNTASLLLSDTAKPSAEELVSWRYPICHEGIPDAPLKLIECGHIFGSNRIIRWTLAESGGKKNHHNCPLCRGPTLGERAKVELAMLHLKQTYVPS